MSDTAPFTLGQFLPYRLNVLASNASRELSRIYSKDYGISIAQWRVLVWLQAKENVTAQFIADAAQMDKAKTSRAIAGLVQMGIVLRDPNKSDLRENYLRLTARGQTLLAELLPRAQAWEDSWLAVLDPSERQALDAILSRLQARLTVLTDISEGE